MVNESLFQNVSIRPSIVRKLPSIELEIGGSEEGLVHEASMNDGVLMDVSSEESVVKEQSLSLSFEENKNRDSELRQTKLKMLKTKYNMKNAQKDLQSLKKKGNYGGGLQKTMFNFGFGSELLTLMDFPEDSKEGMAREGAERYQAIGVRVWRPANQK